MANSTRIALEHALRAKRLDQTLTTASSCAGANASAIPTGVSALDRVLQGGFPHGQLSEIAGPPSSGRLTVALQALAGVTSRGELAAYVDTCDRLDVASAVASGVVLDRLFWVRGHASLPPERALDRALKACMLILQARGFGLVVLDLADMPLPTLARLPPPTWLRLQRVVEGQDTACVLITAAPLARSAGGVTLALTATATWAGTGDRATERSTESAAESPAESPAGGRRVMTGLALEGRVLSPRRRMGGELVLAAHHPWAPPLSAPA